MGLKESLEDEVLHALQALKNCIEKILWFQDYHHWRLPIMIFSNGYLSSISLLLIQRKKK